MPVYIDLSVADKWLMNLLFSNCRKMELSQADYIYDFSDELDDDSPFNFKGSHSVC